MITTFVSLSALRVVGMVLVYATIVWLSRISGPAALGQYLFLLNSAIVIGTLASLGLPTLVQRLSARFDGAHIGAGTRLALRKRWPWMAAVASLGAAILLAIDTDQVLTASGVVLQAVTALSFALTLILVQTIRIAVGPRISEFQRHVVRPSLILALFVMGFGAGWAVPLGILGAAGVALWLSRGALHQNPRGDSELAAYVAERGRDLPTVFTLSAMALVFSAMDVVLFGLLEGSAETGIYGAGSRYGMLVNVALLAGNVQMVHHLARVAARTDSAEESLQHMRRQVRLVRIAGSMLLLALAVALPLYAWIVDLPATQLWPYFAVVGGSFWLQGILGPVDMFLMQAHEAGRLIFYHLLGLAAFTLVGGLLYMQGTMLAVPVAAAVGANTVKLLSWLRIGRSRNLWI